MEKGKTVYVELKPEEFLPCLAEMLGKVRLKNPGMIREAVKIGSRMVLGAIPDYLVDWLAGEVENGVEKLIAVIAYCSDKAIVRSDE